MNKNFRLKNTGTGSSSKKDKLPDVEKQANVPSNYFDFVYSNLAHFNGGNKIISLNIDPNRLKYFLTPDILPDLLDMASDANYSDIILKDYINSIDISNPRDIIFDSKYQAKNRKTMKDEERSLSTIDDGSITVGNVSCPSCKRFYVRKHITQTRSGDEPGTYKYTCIRCNINWSVSTA